MNRKQSREFLARCECAALPIQAVLPHRDTYSAHSHPGIFGTRASALLCIPKQLVPFDWHGSVRLEGGMDGRTPTALPHHGHFTYKIVQSSKKPHHPPLTPQDGSGQSSGPVPGVNHWWP